MRLVGVRKISVLLLMLVLVGGCAQGADQADEGSARPVSLAAGKVESGLSAYERGFFKEAVQDLEDAVEEDPQSLIAKTALGQSYEAVGRLTEAEQEYRAALELDTDLPRIRYKLAIIIKSKGRPEEAIVELEETVQFDPTFAAARLALGDLYADSGNNEKAAEQYQAVVDSEPFGIDLKAVESKLASVK